jgi:hypothetical protein
MTTYPGYNEECFDVICTNTEKGKKIIAEYRKSILDLYD